MRYTTGGQGRVFVLRLDGGEILHEAVERLAVKERIRHAVVFFVGGADEGSTLVVGPEDGRAERIRPMHLRLDGVHEANGVGTLCPNEAGEPVLHLHAGCGRREQTRVGCVREGGRVWLVGEVVIWEITDCRAVRRREPGSGFELLDVP
ncbi:MAG: DNA-binding protein [Kiritimatiellae bacterium]|nr:DNA-binding protein [Kiritimatiellia bacterium]